MAHLTKPTKYNIEDSNIALLGSDLEKRVREHAGDVEDAWEGAGQAPGLQIWRIEKFSVVPWPKAHVGSFYDGDSYIVLNTYKKDPEAEELSYDLHFWLGAETSQDEAGTAAYKTVELDDHLHGAPVEYREVQGSESTRFLSYFPRFVCMKGGVSTGFHHVESLPEPETRRLYEIHLSGTHLIVREVPAEAPSIHEGDVYVLDKGTQLWQFSTRMSVGKEKFKAAEFVRSIADSRKGECEVTVYEEGGQGAGIFLAEFDLHGLLPDRTPKVEHDEGQLALFRISDASGTIIFEPVEPPTRDSLTSDAAYLLDALWDRNPAIYAWIGKDASANEARMASVYGQRYLHEKRASKGGGAVTVPIVKMREGRENAAFLGAIGSS